MATEHTREHGECSANQKPDRFRAGPLSVHTEEPRGGRDAIEAQVALRVLPPPSVCSPAAAGWPHRCGLRTFSLLLPDRHPGPWQGCIDCPTCKTVAWRDSFCECIWQTDRKAPSLRQVLNNSTGGRKGPGQHFSKATPPQPFHLQGSCPSHTVSPNSGGFLS